MTGARLCTPTTSSASSASRSPARAPGSRSRSRRAIGARDGEWRWLRSESQPRWGPVGEHVGFIGVAHDITAAKQAETELRRLNETLEEQVEARTRERDRIWNVSQDILVVADQSGVWLNASPAATARLGWSQAELVGRTSEWIEHPDDIARSRAELGHLAAGRITQRFENRLRHKDGSYRWLSWTARLARGADLCHGARHHRREGSRRDAAAHRGGAAPVAEDGGRRPAHRRHRPRLQQSAARHRRIARPGAEAARRRAAERDPALSSTAPMTSANRAAALTHRLLAFSRRQPLDPKPLRANPLIASHGGPAAPDDGRAHPARAGAGGRPVADAVRPEPAREQHPEPGHQRPRCDARWRQAHDRDQQHASRCQGCRRRPRHWRPASTSASPSPTPAPA